MPGSTQARGRDFARANLGSGSVRVLRRPVVAFLPEPGMREDRDVPVEADAEPGTRAFDGEPAAGEVAETTENGPSAAGTRDVAEVARLGAAGHRGVGKRRSGVGGESVARCLGISEDRACSRGHYVKCFT